MAKIFDVQSEIHESPNRNNFDLTHKRHMTGKFGYIYPFLCQPVVPTDAWSIDTAIGVNLMPMWYPTQSNMRFIVHYFYVPYRLLCKDWKNTLEGLEENDFPFLDQGAEFYETGSLADYLGVPTNYILPQDSYFPYNVLPSRVSYRAYTQNSTAFYVGLPFSGSLKDVAVSSLPKNNALMFLGLEPCLPVSSILNDNGYNVPYINFSAVTVPAHVKLSLVYYGSDINCYSILSGNPTSAEKKNLKFLGEFNLIGDTAAQEYTSVWVDNDFILFHNDIISKAKYVYCAFTITNITDSSVSLTAADFGAFSLPTPKGTNIEVSEHSSFCPYYFTGNETDTVKIRSYPFRAYEMIYNSYYRNSQGNQPFVVDGVTQYNKYLTTDESGADTTHYELKQRNWELDAYTSCLPSPQQGDAPLIGVTVDGRLRVTHDDGTSSVVELRDLDGSAGISLSHSSIDPEHPEDARTIISLASSGLTISDFRAGNALTRFLETSLRTGFRYADFIFGHFGKSPSHQELDMPIFLGGYTQVVDTNKISNVTSGVAGSPLGDFAGTASSFGGAQHGIKHYFDDFGLVMGLVMLVPDPAYSQVLPKHFTYNNRLDFYFNEFSQLGLQPITYEELCPIQSHAEYVNGETSHLLTDTFGYQRPNHDLVWIPDTVHGLFRNSLAGSVINRRFGSRPVLGDEFLRIKPEECNDIFSVIEEKDDTWIGQIVVNITAQRPIPRVVIPSLGR